MPANVVIKYVVDASQLQKGAAASKAAQTATDNLRKSTQQYSNEVKKAGTDSVKSFTDLKTVVASISFVGLLAGLTAVAKKIFDIGVANQQTKISFEVMLGSAEKAKKLLAELTRFSIVTPFTPEQVNKAAKTLLAFGVEAQKIIPTLKILGDVSAGTGKDLSEMAVIFGQIRSTGHLMGNDLIQLINAGFHPLQVIADKTGKSMGELKKAMEKGLITFDMVEQAFKDATGSGGLFFNLMEKQSATVGGQLSTIQGNIEEIAKRLFEAREGGLASFIEGIAILTSHIDESADAINTWISMVTFIPRKTLEIVNDFREKLIPALQEVKRQFNEMFGIKTEGGATSTWDEEVKKTEETTKKIYDIRQKVGNKVKKDANEVQEYLAYLSDLELFQQQEMLKEQQQNREDAAKRERDSEKNSHEVWRYFQDLKAQKARETEEELFEIREDAVEAERKRLMLIRDLSEELFRGILEMALMSRDEDINGLRNYYDEQIELAGDNTRRRKELEIQRERDVQQAEARQKKADQKNAETKILIDGLVAIGKIFAQFGWPAGIVPAGIMAGITAVNASQVRKYKEGEINIKGPGSETSDSIPAMLSKGESIMTAKQTREAFGILTDVRAGKLNDKILKQMVVGGGSQSFNDERIVGVLHRIEKKSTDFERIGRQLYRVQKDGDGNKRRIRSKSI